MQSEDNEELDVNMILKEFTMLKEIENDETKNAIANQNKNVNDAIKKQAFIDRKTEEELKN